MQHLVRATHVFSTLLLALGVAAAQGRPERGQSPPAERPAPETRQPAQAPASLDAARAAFRSADANSDGTLDAVEAGKAGIDGRRIPDVDTDGTAGLSSDEFVVAFQRQAEREQREVAPDLAAETTRIRAARPAPAAVPQPTASATTPPAAQTHEEKLKAILESLNKRVRNSEFSQEEALATYEKVSKRLDNALLGTAGVQGTLSKDDYLKQVKESLNTRVRKAELSDADALALYERVAQRIDRALASGAPTEAAPATPPDAGTPAPADGQPVQPPPQGGAQRPRQPADGNAPPPAGGPRRAREPVPAGTPPRGPTPRPRQPPPDKPAGSGGGA